MRMQCVCNADAMHGPAANRISIAWRGPVFTTEMRWATLVPATLSIPVGNASW